MDETLRRRNCEGRQHHEGGRIIAACTVASEVRHIKPRDPMCDEEEVPAGPIGTSQRVTQSTMKKASKVAGRGVTKTQSTKTMPKTKTRTVAKTETHARTSGCRAAASPERPMVPCPRLRRVTRIAPTQEMFPLEPSPTVPFQFQLVVSSIREG
jgi:hypothetical protein